jgi:L-threonylcarbamoyladenylate synthase
VVLPTDGVYGLCASPYREAPVRQLYELKGRDLSQPSAIIASSIDLLFECVPELRGRSGVIVRALLPGPYTLILPNPARRYPWVNGAQPATIGVRVVDLPLHSQQVLDAVGAVVATSANDPGQPAAASLEEVAERLRSGAGAEIDAGRLSGVASTVLDFSGAEPAVVREGAGSSVEALERVAKALSASDVA